MYLMTGEANRERFQADGYQDGLTPELRKSFVSLLREWEAKKSSPSEFSNVPRQADAFLMARG